MYSLAHAARSEENNSIFLNNYTVHVHPLRCNKMISII